MAENEAGSPADGRTVVITGAFRYSGKYTTQLLLEHGWRVRTLTHHPQREYPFGGRVAIHAYDFEHPERLRESLRGAEVLINTYWVRFPHGGVGFATAVENTRRLIATAVEAGVRRLVHVSIANPSLDSPLGYYRGKAQVEEAVRQSGLSYAILRPTVIFGAEDILINNIAWFVRCFPVFGIPGDGRYGVQPIFVEDMASLLADAAASSENYVRDATGSEAYTFEELVRLIAAALGRRIRLVHLPKLLAYVATRCAGWWVGDVVLTWEEYGGLMSNLLVSREAPAGKASLREWLAANRERVGLRYASEIARHFQPSG